MSTFSNNVKETKDSALGKLSQKFYDDRRLIILLLLLVTAAGINSLLVLPRMEDPPLTNRAARVTTIFPGADAERVEALVTEKLEDRLLDVPEIKRIRSQSRAGSSFLSIELRDDIYDTEPVWSEIRGKIEDSTSELPSGAGRPEFDDLEIAAYAWIGAVVWEREDEVAWGVVRRLARDLKDQLFAVSGSKSVDLFGDPLEEVLVEIDSEKAALAGLSAASIAQQIANRDIKTSAGVLRSHEAEFVIKLENQFRSISDIENATLVTNEPGETLKLSEVAEIRRSTPEPPATRAIIDGNYGVAVCVYLRPEYRIDHWAKDAQKVVDDFSEQLPPGISLQMIMEQEGYVSDRITNLIYNLMLGVSAVALVTLLFMGWRSSLLVTATLPIASLMVFGGMRILGIPIHQMSVTGLIIALGLMIDNAIIATDEIQHSRRRGLKPREAVHDLVRRLFAPLLASTVTTALAFAPIALIGGPAGEFVGAIAVTVMLAIFSSFILAMTVLPASAALLQNSLKEESSTSVGVVEPNKGWRGLIVRCKHFPLTCWQHGLRFPGVTKIYRKFLTSMLARPWFGVLAGCVLPIAGFLSATQLEEQFFPPADRDQFHLELELAPQSSMSQTEDLARKVHKLLMEHKRIESVSWFLGESAPTFYYNIISRRKNSPNYAQAIVTLTNNENARDLIRELQFALDEAAPEARVLARQLEQGPPFDAPVEVRLLGPNLDVLRELGQEVRAVATMLPDVLHARTKLNESVPFAEVQVDPREVSWAGLSESEVAQQLFATFEGLNAGTIIEQVEEVPVRVRVDQSSRQHMEDLQNSVLLVGTDTRAPGNEANPASLMVPVRSIANTTLKPQTSVIERYNGRRNNQIDVFITAGVLPSQVLGDLVATLDRRDFVEELPLGYSLQIGGEASERDAAVGGLMSNVSVLAVGMIGALILALSSFRLMGLIGIVATLSIGLGMGALWVFGYPFGFMAIIGTMGLIGIAINDSIVVVAALRENELVMQGDVDATADTIVNVTRHVLATTMTTVFGFMPLLLSGGGFWPPLAVAIGTGVVGATLISLTLVPAVFRLMFRPRTADAGSVALS